MKVLDLFSGIGGFSLGLERAGLETIAFCEIEPFCQKILNQHWPDVPVFEDIRKLKISDLQEMPDLICGGYPCQPFSVAGKQRGQKDDRHLWPEMFRLIKECTPPPLVIAENVVGHVRMGLDSVLFDLESAGYSAQSFVIPACAINAPHKRDRVWIVGYPKHYGSSSSENSKRFNETSKRPSKGPEPALKPQRTGRLSNDENVAYSQSKRIQRYWTGGEQISSAHERPSLSGGSCQRTRDAQWETEPSVGRVVDGIPNRVDRIKSLGNAVVPQILEIFGGAIMALKD